MEPHDDNFSSLFVEDIVTGSVISELMHKIDQLNESLTERIDKLQGACLLEMREKNAP